MSDYGSYPPPPAGYGPSAYRPAPPSYLVWSILSTLFCCLPFGIVSIVHAARVDSRWAAGDHHGAYNESQKAKQWAIWSAIAGVVFGVIWALVVLGTGLDSGPNY